MYHIFNEIYYVKKYSVFIFEHLIKLVLKNLIHIDIFKCLILVLYENPKNFSKVL